MLSLATAYVSKPVNPEIIPEIYHFLQLETCSQNIKVFIPEIQFATIALALTSARAIANAHHISMVVIDIEINNTHIIIII